MMRNLILSGGVGHPFDDTSRILAEMLVPLDITTEIVAPDQWESAIDARAGDLGLITVNALRWRMLAERYHQHRDTESYTTTASLQNFIEQHLLHGGAVLSMHTSCISFDDWPNWAEILGAVWDWDRSFHPLLGTEVHVHDVLHHTRFTLTDELYHGLQIKDPDRDVLATASTPADAVVANPPPMGVTAVGGSHAVVWQRKHGPGRVVVDTLGHDHRSLSDVNHQRVLLAALKWAVAK